MVAGMLVGGYGTESNVTEKGRNIPPAGFIGGDIHEEVVAYLSKDGKLKRISEHLSLTLSYGSSREKRELVLIIKETTDSGDQERITLLVEKLNLLFSSVIVGDLRVARKRYEDFIRIFTQFPHIEDIDLVIPILKKHGFRFRG